MKQTISVSSETLPTNLPIFGGIPHTKIDSVLQCFKAHGSTFSQGDLLAGEETQTPFLRYLIQGKVLIVHYDQKGNRFVLGSCNPYVPITCTLSPYFCKKNPVDVIAEEPCVLIDFLVEPKIDTYPQITKYIGQFYANLSKDLMEANIRLIKHLDMVSNRSLRDRILSYLKDQPGAASGRFFTIPFNRQELADYLYVARSALSRELSQMKQDGIINYRKNEFMILE